MRLESVDCFYRVSTVNAAFRFFLLYLQTILIFLAMFFVLRILLLSQNLSLVETADLKDLVRGFWIGARFDLRMASYAVFPIIFIPFLPFRNYRYFCLTWITTFVGFYLLFGLIELEFYGEFQQRLNILVVQYLEEDLSTITGMIWNGFPVLRYLSVWLLLTILIGYGFSRLIHTVVRPTRWFIATPLVILLLLVSVLFARGTVRSGPPLRWGDAYQSEVMFVNHLGLNGSFTLIKALIDRGPSAKHSKWRTSFSRSQALEITRSLLLSGQDEIIDAIQKPVLRRKTTDSPAKNLNVVVILMESYSGQFVGALGNKSGVTPEFDRLSQEGLLLTNAFSNGTHTHQGTFATLACFPNLPGYEYLMQQQEGMNEFSGLTSLVPDYNSTFVYNGDFRWDNQVGFFKNQGMDKFIGRDDYVNPVLRDGVWGVSDEDMFNRAEVELDRLSVDGNFLVYLQTLSNHIPYNIPLHESFEPITNEGDLSDRLTAMKYSDWALGQFFRNIRNKPYYKDTIFVVLGDHGFGTDNQLTEINLLRFHVPILIIAPGLHPGTSSIITSQLDVIPTILGLMQSPVPHQCWGRDVLVLPDDDHGFAVIKPSGSEPTMAILKQDRILTFDHDLGSHLYELQMYPEPKAKLIDEPFVSQTMRQQLEAFVQTALQSLEDNTAGS